MELPPRPIPLEPGDPEVFYDARRTQIDLTNSGFSTLGEAQAAGELTVSQLNHHATAAGLAGVPGILEATQLFEPAQRLHAKNGSVVLVLNETSVVPDGSSVRLDGNFKGFTFITPPVEALPGEISHYDLEDPYAGQPHRLILCHQVEVGELDTPYADGTTYAYAPVISSRFAADVPLGEDGNTTE